jgi:thymidylate kinase
MLLSAVILNAMLFIEKTSVILYDRFLIDTLVDLSYETGRFDLWTTFVGRIMLAFSRKLNLVVLMDLDASLAFGRTKKEDVLSIGELAQKRNLYTNLISQLPNVFVVDARGPIGQTIQSLFRILGLKA